MELAKEILKWVTLCNCSAIKKFIISRLSFRHIPKQTRGELRYNVWGDEESQTVVLSWSDGAGLWSGNVFLLPVYHYWRTTSYFLHLLIFS